MFDWQREDTEGTARKGKRQRDLGSQKAALLEGDGERREDGRESAEKEGEGGGQMAAEAAAEVAEEEQPVRRRGVRGGGGGKRGVVRRSSCGIFRTLSKY